MEKRKLHTSILHVLLNKWVSDTLHAIHGADECDSGAPAHHQAQRSGIHGQLVWVIRISQILNTVIKHNVEQRIITLQHPTALPPPCKLHSDLLVNEPAQIQDRLLQYQSNNTILHNTSSTFFLFSPSPCLAGAADMIQCSYPDHLCKWL